MAEGLPIRAQVAPRPVGLLVGLQSSYHPFLMLPAWRDIAGLPVAEQARALRDPAFRDRLLAEMPDDDGQGGRRAGGAGSSTTPTSTCSVRCPTTSLRRR